METNRNQPILEKLGEKLVLAQREIEELALQFSLGKADALDAFEELKHEFRKQVREWKQLLSSEKDADLIEEIAVLEAQLKTEEPGKKNYFEEQKANILMALLVFEDGIKKRLNKVQTFGFADHEIEKFKLKLEIISLRLKLKKFEISDGFRDHMKEASDKIESLVKRGKANARAGTEKLADLRDEAEHAYTHIRKALSKL